MGQDPVPSQGRLLLQNGMKMPQPRRSGKDPKEPNEKDANPPTYVVALRSNPGNERAEKQPHKQTPDVRSVVGMGNDCPEEEVVPDKHDYTSQRSRHCRARHPQLP